jgi:hypothetical protein
MAPQSAMLPVRYRVEQYREKSAMLESSRCYDLNGVHFSKKLDRFIHLTKFQRNAESQIVWKAQTTSGLK